MDDVDRDVCLAFASPTRLEPAILRGSLEGDGEDSGAEFTEEALSEFRSRLWLG